MEAGELLINEFSDITVSCIFNGHLPYKTESFENYGDISFYDEFDFIFQKKYLNKSIEGDSDILLQYAPNKEYYNYLDLLRLTFQNEISEFVEKESSSFRIINKLQNYLERFKELYANYYDREISYEKDDDEFIFTSSTDKIIKVIHKDNRIVKYKDDMTDTSANMFYLSKLKDSYLTCQTKIIDLIIPYIEKKIELVKEFPKEKEVNPVPITIKPSNKLQFPEKESFELNPDLFDSDSELTDKLQEFKNLLLQYGYIEQIDTRLFMQVFKNQSITQPIKWTGSSNELYYLIKNLYDKNIIIRFKNYWSVACKCFNAYDKKKKLCTPYYLQRCKAPTRSDQLRKLNSVIDTLK